MALGRRQPAVGLLHHSDQGSQYAGQAYQGLLANAGVRWSMSRKGDSLDNAVAERFFGSLKRERTAHCQYTTRQEARNDVVDYIEMFYNSKRKRLCRKFCSGGHEGAVGPVCVRIKQPGSRTVRPQ
jgi:putative transposase